MIKDTYSVELKSASAIIYEKNFLTNFTYKIMRDRNIQDFLNSLHSKAYNYENLETTEKNSFNRALSEVKSVLFSYKDAIRNSNTFKGKSSEDIYKSCNVLSDQSGKDVLFILGHMPVLISISEKQTANEFFSNLLSEEELNGEKSQIDIMETNQRKLVLRSQSNLRVPRDRTLVNYRLRNEKILQEKEKYENSRLKDLNLLIDEMHNSANDYNFSYEYFVNVGKAYWESTEKNRRKLEEGFSEVIESIYAATTKKENEIRKKASLIIQGEIEDMSPSQKGNFNVEMHENGTFTLTTKEELPSSSIIKIEELIMLRGDFELYNVRLEKDEDKLYQKVNDMKVYTFSCILDIE